MIKLRLILLLSLVVLILPACSPAPSVTLTSASSVAPSLILSDCRLTSPSGTTTRARCGKLPVYEDQVHRSGRKIELNIAVIPAISRSPQPDALFLLAGGPGQAATEAFLPLLPVFSRINQKRDLVLFDQRGTGASHPLNCPSTGGGEMGETPGSQDDVEQVKTCLSSLDADTRLYTTSASVEDLEQVRQALGYPQVNLLGVSYGTRYALAYLQRYPHNVRAVILDGVVPPGWRIGAAAPQDAQRALDLIFDRCAKDEACQGAFPQLRQEFADVMNSLEKTPLEITLPDPSTNQPTPLMLTRAMLASMLHALTYTPETVALLPLLIHTASRGDAQPLAAQYLIVSADLEQSMSSGLQLSILCAEDIIDTTGAGADTGSYLPDPTSSLIRACSAWTHAQAVPEFQQPVQSDVPVLLLSGEADPITPPANGDLVARTLTHSLHLVAPGMGHNVIFRGCLPKIAANFIETASNKDLDTRCVQDIQPLPFFLDFAGPQP